MKRTFYGSVASQLLGNMSTASTVLIAPSVVMLFLLTTMAIATAVLLSQRSGVHKIDSVVIASYRETAALAEMVSTHQAGLYRLTALGANDSDKNKVEQGRSKLSGLLVAAEAALQSYARLGDNSANSRLKNLGSLLAYKKASSEVVEMVSSDVAMATMMMVEVDEVYQGSFAEIELLRTATSDDAAAINIELGNSLRWALLAFCAVGVIAASVSIAIPCLRPRQLHARSPG